MSTLIYTTTFIFKSKRRLLIDSSIIILFFTIKKTPRRVILPISVLLYCYFDIWNDIDDGKI